jgi:hypothetical protein
MILNIINQQFFPYKTSFLKKLEIKIEFLKTGLLLNRRHRADISFSRIATGRQATQRILARGRGFWSFLLFR